LSVLKEVLVPINRAGWPFIAVFAAVTLLLALWSLWLAVPGALLTAWCTYFFRDPPRVTPVRDGLVISPADGRVVMTGTAEPPPELELGPGPWTRVAIFMNVFDVHVNRIPIDGRVTRLAYKPGKFFNASLDKASEFNERQSVRLETTDAAVGGATVGVVQIAGLVARRIKCNLVDGHRVVAGERFGLIRFGSRVDVYLPAGVPIFAVVGQRAVAGETVLADFAATEAPRQGRTE
jgi:phosphatidylserine decarboxylase